MVSRALLFGGILVFVSGLTLSVPAHGQTDVPPSAPPAVRQFDTDLTRSTIDLSELVAGGPSKDGIPSIDDPSFVSTRAASDWIGDNEPVIALVRSGDARAYPLQILMYHEIVNDRVGDTPVAVTFCPLCYSSIAFERIVDGKTVTFGVSGLLRKSDLVMYDRASETLWQQFTGEAVVGTHAGKTLTVVPSQLLSFRQFIEHYPGGQVLSRDTGYERPYGTNPYAGYDDIDEPPFAFEGATDERLPPKARVVGVTIDSVHKAYPHSITRSERVIHDTVADQPLVVFHAPGAVSAVDATQISNSKDVGSSGVFLRTVKGTRLDFSYAGAGRFRDENTGTVWTVAGHAIKGPLKGARLEPVTHGDYFAFSWLAFRPHATIFRLEND